MIPRPVTAREKRGDRRSTSVCSDLGRARWSAQGTPASTARRGTRRAMERSLVRRTNAVVRRAALPRAQCRRGSTHGGKMADVQIQQTPDAGGSSASWVWALVVLVIVGVLAWFVFGGGLH